MKFTEKQKVFEFIKSYSPDWVSGLRLEKWALEDYKMRAGTALRRARELVRGGLIERSLENHCVKYRYLPPRPQTQAEIEQESLEHLILAVV